MSAAPNNALITFVIDIGSGFFWLNASGDVVVTPGELFVHNGGTIADTVVALGGETIISAGGSAIGTTVQDGGSQYVLGTAIGTLVASNGHEFAVASGVTSGATIFKGGFEFIGLPADPGYAVGMTVNGGVAQITNSGSTATGTDVINGGVLTVSSGGTASGTSVTGGTMNVSSGGTASGVSVGSGGTLTVSSGGVVSALTINDPNDPNVTAVANVLSGGKVDGSTKIDGGQLILDAGAVFQPHATLTITNTGELVLEQDSFKGTIKDFGSQDFMDLQKIRFIGQGPDATTATFTQTNGAGGQLQVAQGSHVADLHLAGVYTTANFALQSDGVHGTTVTFVP